MSSVTSMHTNELLAVEYFSFKLKNGNTTKKSQRNLYMSRVNAIDWHYLGLILMAFKFNEAFTFVLISLSNHGPCL